MADDVIEVPAPAPSPTVAFAKARYQELQAQKAALVAELQPFRDDYERLTNAPRLVECRAAIKRLNGLIGPVDNELAQLAKVLGGKSLGG